MFELKPDYETAQKRIDAWWNGEVIDRALTFIYIPKPKSEQKPLPVSRHRTRRERWMDVEFRAEEALAGVRNYICYADAIPVVMPDLGPDWFSSLYGCELDYNETSSWSKPILKDCTAKSLSDVRLDMNSAYLKKMTELADAYVNVAKGRCLVGYPDFHPGGDALAAMRGSQDLCMDLLEHPKAIKAFLRRVTDDYLRVYDVFHSKLAGAGLPSVSWISLPVRGRFHIAQNDFSCLISPDMFKEFFVPVFTRECSAMDRTIYHLDGPDAVRHLDQLLEVPNLHAIQWVPGAGHGSARRWLPLCKRVQKAGKGILMYLDPWDLDAEFFDTMRPEGAYIHIPSMDSKEEADAILKKIAKWGK